MRTGVVRARVPAFVRGLTPGFRRAFPGSLRYLIGVPHSPHLDSEGSRLCGIGEGAGGCNKRDLLDVALFVTDVTPDLTMYSTTWCGYCRRLKTQLKEAGISYVEVDIEQDPASAEFVGSVNNGNHVVPTLKFADGSTATNPSLSEVKQALARQG